MREHAQRADCLRISIIDKRHSVFLLQGISASFSGKFILPVKVLLKNVSYGNLRQPHLCAFAPLSLCAFYWNRVRYE
ncbi:MAG: hypothetical protein C4538_12890 [Nitrospiraceae bacterium]|nr:MAG: hypothetical protein C4538_12890 [Nitrospiraceae bacterium]